MTPVHRLPPHPEFLFEQGISELDEESDHGPVILRRKRAAAKEKNTCQLFIQTDHFFYKYYGTREAVIAQVCRATLDWTPLYFSGIVEWEMVAPAPTVPFSADLQPREGHQLHLPGHRLQGHSKHQLHGEAH